VGTPLGESRPLRGRCTRLILRDRWAAELWKRLAYAIVTGRARFAVPLGSRRRLQKHLLLPLLLRRHDDDGDDGDDGDDDGYGRCVSWQQPSADYLRLLLDSSNF